MPYKSSKIKLPESLDRRIKIPRSEYKNIIALYRQGEFIRAIARKYGVDHRLIQFILFPDRKVKNLQDRADRGGSKQYYNKDKWREVMREHRAYKHNLHIKKLI